MHERHIHCRRDERNVELEVGRRDLLLSLELGVGVEAEPIIRDENWIGVLRQLLTAQFKADHETHASLRQPGEGAAADPAVEKLILRFSFRRGLGNRQREAPRRCRK